MSPHRPRARLRLVELECRLAPAVFDVTFHGPPEGTAGDTDAAHGGGLAVTGGTPQVAGTTRVTAASAALAVHAALSGAVEVTLGGQATTYAFGPAAASGDRALALSGNSRLTVRLDPGLTTGLTITDSANTAVTVSDTSRLLLALDGTQPGWALRRTSPGPGQNHTAELAALINSGNIQFDLTSGAQYQLFVDTSYTYITQPVPEPGLALLAAAAAFGLTPSRRPRRRGDRTATA